MNAIVQANTLGAVSTKFQGAPLENDLAAGVQGGYGHIGYKGKVWAIRYRGEDTPLLRADGDGPMNSIELVVLAASKSISKIFYESGFVEGSSAPPDCFSTNGVTPDPGSAKKQCSTCAACPKNAWGSHITPAGKQGKACRDSRRVAVAPLGDVKNEAYGGAMLMRIPAASLQDLANYGNKLSSMGYQYYAVGTRVAFDPNEAYPKFVFSPIRVLTDAEADMVIEHRNSPQVARILSEGSEVSAPAAASPPLQFEQPPATQPAPAPQPVSAPQPAPATQMQVVQATTPAAKPASAVNGFGGAAPVTAPVTPTPTPTPAATTAPPTAPVQAASNSDFEASLDADLDALLPK